MVIVPLAAWAALAATVRDMTIAIAMIRLNNFLIFFIVFAPLQIF